MTGRRLGVVLAGGLPVADMIEVAKFSEERGLDAVFTTDHTPREAFTPLTAIAASTDSIAIGTGIASVYTRDPVTTASMAITIDEVSGGRLILGLGTGGYHIRAFGIPLRKPVKTLTEYFEIVRRSLTGRRLSYSGQIYTISNWDLGVKPSREYIPMYLGGVGPNLVRLAGQIADGLFLGAVNPLRHVRYAVDRATESCKETGKDPSSFDSAAALLTSIARTSTKAKKQMKLALAYYVGFKVFERILEAEGFGRERLEIASLIEGGRIGEAAARVTDKMVDALTVSGTPEECRARIDEYRAAGLKLPCLYPALPDHPRLKEQFVSAIRALTD